MAYKKNDYLTVTIEDMGSGGEGIGKVEGFTLFVKDAVIGDTAQVKLVKVKKNYAYARLEKVLTPSPYRVEPVCPTYRQCGGCQLQVLSYERQLVYKQQKVRNDLIHIGGFAPELVDQVMGPIIGMDTPLRYRNKAQYPVGTDREGNPVAGFYAGRTHSIIPNIDCCLGAEENEEILRIILDYMREYRVPVYDETTGQGLIRHVLIRKGFCSGELMVCLVINRSFGKDKNMTAQGSAQREFLPGQQTLIDRLTRLSGMRSISVSINTERTNVIMGEEIHILWGQPTISDTIHVRDMQKEGYPLTGRELTFHISPVSFYQVNPVQTEKLYSLVLEYAGLTGRETVWDLYCGIGTISLFLAEQAGKVYGVEIIPQAIEDAKENARANGIANAEFWVGRAEEVLPRFYEKLSSGELSGEDMLHPDVIVVDPPRKGCDEACLDTMLKMQPERIVYVSCDPATLARDLKVLCEGGYEIKRVRPTDMFGNSVHVESVCLLSKLHAK
ncbi:MAG: 23S rRNA (uracil(1939)-C(5))-methyltransferase RlmD [Butyrivibrio sp.]|nr:23S rRNA (uracil(1939)-C(5))-methyltransferase RlmD [Muribaculum sp.]MCM1551388.1 23S rRNA (uracil(1939)-C(5))-methyltransferase RlmD [Butyrivibrio sp.]